MKVKIIRATVAAGRDVFPGDEVDVSAADARLLCVTGRAIPFDAPDAGDDLDAPDAPDAPGAPDAPDAPGAPDAPDAGDDLDAPDAGDDLDAPDAPDAGDDLMSTAPVRRGGKSKKRSS